MDGASRDAARATERHLDEILAAVPDPHERGFIGETLFSVVDLLDREITLRRTVVDPTLPPRVRADLVTTLLGQRIAPPVVDLLADAVGRRWSRPRDLVDTLEEAAAVAMFAGAEAAGVLDDVEDEIFRFARVVEREPQLRAALVDPALPADRKRALLDLLLAERAHAATRYLVTRAVLDPRGVPFEAALDTYARLAAARRDRIVADVRVAVPLTSEQSERLRRVLAGIYGRAVALQVEIDPDVLGGVSVRVGDEIIDGTVAGRLAAAGRRLTGS